MHVLNDMQEHCEFDKCFWCRYFSDLVQSGVDLPGGGGGGDAGGALLS
jgi:hypothetical protein